jgi:hypothetical protein
MADAVALRFTADAKQAKKELKGLGGDLVKLASSFAKVGIDALKTAEGLAFVQAVAVKAGKALVSNARQIATVGDQIAKTAREVGLSGEQFQILAFAAERADIPVAAISDGLKKLSQSMFDLSPEAIAARESLDQMGISITKTDGSLREADVVFLDIADHVQNLGITTETTAQLMQAMGKTGPVLGNLLLEGSAGIVEMEARLRAIGGVMSKETLDASEAFENSMTDLKLAISGLKTGAAAPLIPVLAELANTMVAVVAAMQPIAAIIGNIAGFTAAFVLSALELAGIAEKGALRRSFGFGGAAAPVGTGLADITGLAVGPGVVDVKGKLVGKAFGAKGGRGDPGEQDGIARREDAWANFLTGRMESFAETSEALLGIEFDRLDSEIAQERAHLAEMGRLKDLALQEDERRADERRRLAQMTRDYQTSAAQAAFGAVETFAGIAQGAVEDSYFGQTKAGRVAAKAMFIAGKAAALATAIVNTAKAISEANALPFPANVPAIAAAGITGAASIGTIIATTIQGIADAGLPPGALRAAGLNRHTALAVRNDEMILDPKGTQEITQMLSVQRRQMEMSQGGANGRPVIVVAELDGQRLTRGLSPHLTRALEGGHDFRRNVRVAGAA